MSLKAFQIYRQFFFSSSFKKVCQVRQRGLDFDQTILKRSKTFSDLKNFIIAVVLRLCYGPAGK